MRIDVINRLGEVLRSFEKIEDAADFARIFATIPGEYVVLAFYANGKIVDVMAWGI